MPDHHPSASMFSLPQVVRGEGDDRGNSSVTPITMKTVDLCCGRDLAYTSQASILSQQVLI